MTETTEMTEQPGNGTARIADLGYQHYTGARLGVTHTFNVMTLAAMRRGLGLRRPFRDKILPWSLIGIAFLPTVAFLLIQVITGGALGKGAFYSNIANNLALFYLLFAGLVAPDLICADRRMRVVSLYFASPIRRSHYIGAQVLAQISLLAILTVIPNLVLFIGNALLAGSAADYVRNNAGDLWHLLLGGLIIAVYYSAIALAVAAFTDRRPYASGFFLGFLLVTDIVSSIIFRAMQFNGHEWFVLANLWQLPIYVMDWFFGATHPNFRSTLTGTPYLIATLVVIVVSLVALVWRYMEVKD